jgi:hypothetical protein
MAGGSALLIDDHGPAAVDRALFRFGYFFGALDIDGLIELLTYIRRLKLSDYS